MLPCGSPAIEQEREPSTLTTCERSDSRYSPNQTALMQFVQLTYSTKDNGVCGTKNRQDKFPFIHNSVTHKDCTCVMGETEKIVKNRWCGDCKIRRSENQPKQESTQKSKLQQGDKQ